MKRDVVVMKAGQKLVIGRPTSERRILELSAKKGAKTQAELLEELLLRTRRIERHLGISNESN